MDPQAQPPVDSGDAPAPLPQALRIQIAAVAAQQVALDEEEIRLEEERIALQAQQEQLALNVEEKRQQLQLLSDRAQAERAQVQLEREAYERHIERITGDLSQPQRAILEAEKHIHEERERLAGMQHKLKQRFAQHWDAKEQEHADRAHAQADLADALAERDHRLHDAEANLRQRRLQFNGDAELSRLQLNEAWGKLRRAQFRWKHRRGLERAALRVRGHQLEAAAQQIAQARSQLAADQQAWLTQRQALEQELSGVNTRVENQRGVMHRQEERLRWLEQQILLKDQQLAGAPTNATAPSTDVGEPRAEAGANRTVPAPALADPVRIVDLDRLADDLADQRRQVVEAWLRVAALHDQWHADRTQAAADIEALANRLLERDLIVQERQQAAAQAEEVIKQRHDELTRAQEHIIGWGAQLRTEENAWEGERNRLVADLSSKDAAVEQHLAELSDLRQRWAKRRKQELENLASERAALEMFREEFAQQRLELAQRLAAADEGKRKLAEKALALEQYRAKVLAHAADDPKAERRLERLRRRWLTHNADAIRQAARERTALHAELLALEQRHVALERRAAEVSAAETDLFEKQTVWEQHQVSQQAQHSRLEQDLQHAQEQRRAAEQQLIAMRDEVDHIARALLDQPDAPILPLERAA